MCHCCIRHGRCIHSRRPSFRTQARRNRLNTRNNRRGRIRHGRSSLRGTHGRYSPCHPNPPRSRTHGFRGIPHDLSTCFYIGVRCTLFRRNLTLHRRSTRPWRTYRARCRRQLLYYYGTSSLGRPNPACTRTNGSFCTFHVPGRTSRHTSSSRNRCQSSLPRTGTAWDHCIGRAQNSSLACKQNLCCSPRRRTPCRRHRSQSASTSRARCSCFCNLRFDTPFLGTQGSRRSRVGSTPRSCCSPSGIAS
jgi:hypothetical protein